MSEVKMTRQRSLSFLGALLLMVAIAFGLGFVWRGKSGTALRDGAKGLDITMVPLSETSTATGNGKTLQSAFGAVAQATNPAVVTITTQRKPPQPGAGQRGDSRDQFEEFFRRFHDFSPNSFPSGSARHFDFNPVQREDGGMGSGFVYRQDGIILTNAHVVKDAATVTVKLADDRTFKDARVLGADERTDVAVVKINTSNLPVVQPGDSSAVSVGDWAIAVGNPFGLEHTLTVGVISAKAREVPLQEFSAGDYLQTDASINPGNSGGPLLDIQGRVIGVNTATFSQSGGNIGIGFAIPINTARRIAEMLIEEGKVRRAYLGARISNVEDRAAAFGLDSNTKGVLIEGVEPDTPAARAGLQPSDVVQAFNEQSVTRSSELQRLVSGASVGSSARLTILRGGQTLTVTARLEELKEDK